MIILIRNLKQLIRHYNKRELRFYCISMTYQGTYMVIIKYHYIGISLFIFNYCYFNIFSTIFMHIISYNKVIKVRNAFIVQIKRSLKYKYSS